MEKREKREWWCWNCERYTIWKPQIEDYHEHWKCSECQLLRDERKVRKELLRRYYTILSMKEPDWE